MLHDVSQTFRHYVIDSTRDFGLDILGEILTLEAGGNSGPISKFVAELLESGFKPKIFQDRGMKLIRDDPHKICSL